MSALFTGLILGCAGLFLICQAEWPSIIEAAAGRRCFEPVAGGANGVEWLGGWLDLWIGSQSIQRRNMGSHTGVGWQIASQTTRCLDNVFGRIEHVAKKTSLLVAVGLLVQLRLL